MEKLVTRKSNLTPWIYKQEPCDRWWFPPEGAYGFTYEIVCKPNKRRYIGKKSFKRKRKDKNNKIFLAESNWRNYFGSSNHVDNDVSLYGYRAFDREMLKICYSSLELSYQETKLLFVHETIETDEFYNQSIGGKYYASNLFPST